LDGGGEPLQESQVGIDQACLVDVPPLHEYPSDKYAERFVLSVRSECLDRIIPLGEWHLRHAISEYLKHYHQERNHQGLGNVLIDSSVAANDNGRVRRHQRLGGLLSYYHRKAA
jgi:putative transposase